jgi:Protein of unknown function (DUF1403)
MPDRLASFPSAPSAPRPLPGWARAKDEISQDVDAAFVAGATLAALDARVRAEAPFAGLWRNRLALAAAVAQIKLSGRREGETDLRDALALATTDAGGPAAGVLKGWRTLANRSTGISRASLDQVAEAFGLQLGDAIDGLERLAAHAARGELSPLQAVAAVLAAVRRDHPRAEFLGFWIADAILAQRLGWPIPLPLVVTGFAQRRGRTAAGERDGFAGVALGYARAAAGAIDLYSELARRADKLLAAAPRLRAKGASAVVAALLDDDAIAPAARLGGMSDRGMRRLCDRLVGLGAARELTGRAAFRLYGL